MTLVAHVTTDTRISPLTWRRDTAVADSDAFNTFLGKWAAKLASEREKGSFSGSLHVPAHSTLASVKCRAVTANPASCATL